MALTVAELAAAKGFDPDWLRGEFFLRESWQGVLIPYFDATGYELTCRIRSALRAKDGSYWPKGAKLSPYGAWRLGAAGREGRLIMVEGETDLWALARLGLPALGVPGAGGAGCLAAEHVEAVSLPGGRLYVHAEPDRAGRQFTKGVLWQLAELGFEGAAFELTLPAGVKDPADLHARDPGGARQVLEERLRLARPRTLPPPLPEAVEKYVRATLEEELPAYLAEELPAAVEKLVRQQLAGKRTAS